LERLDQGHGFINRGAQTLQKSVIQGDKKVLRWGLTDIRRRCTKFSHHGAWRRGFVYPCSY